MAEHRKSMDDRREPDEDATDEDSDFASEHKSSTFADQMRGGPEGVEEPESPSGRGGHGGMDPDKPAKTKSCRSRD